MNEEWVASYIGPLNNARDVSEVVVTDDMGNAYVTGWSWHGGGCVGGVCTGPMYNFVTVKYNETGVEQWTQIYNHMPGDAYDIAWDMARDPNSGNLYVVGESTSEFGYFYDYLDYSIVAYDSAGTELWVRTYDSYGENDSAYAVAVDPVSGNVYVTGKSAHSRDVYSDFDHVTVAYTSTGTFLWEARRLSEEGRTYFGRYCDIAVGPSGTVYFTGDIENEYMITIAYDPLTGSELWNATYDVHNLWYDYPRSMVVDPNTENIYVTGTSLPDTSGTDYITLAYDSSGNELWNATYDGPANDDDEAFDIVLDSAGNVFVTGFSMGVTTDYDYLTIGYDNSGSELWVSRYNAPGDDWDQAYAIAIDDSDNLFVTGHCCGDADINLNALGDIATIGYDSVTGDEISFNLFASASGGRDVGNDVTVDSDGNVYVAGNNHHNVTHYNFVTIKYAPEKILPTAVTGPDQVISENMAVQLDGTASFDTDGAIISYAWDLDIGHDSSGDAIPDNDIDVTGATPSVAWWNDDHTSTVKLTVKDDDGGTASDTMTVTVGNLDPSGDFNVAYDPAQGFVYDWIASDPGSDDLTVTLEIGPLAPIVETYYNDGVGADPNPSPYTGTAPFGIADAGIEPTSLPPGVYACNFEVADDDGGLYEDSGQVTITNLPPDAEFTYNPPNPGKNEIIQFTDASTDPDDSVVRWEWEFGDGTTSTLQNPTHSYPTNRSYTITLTVWDEHDANDTISYVIVIENLAPEVGFSYLPDEPKISETVTFADESSDSDGSIVFWHWDFGDGTTSTDQNPIHSYSGEGTFTVTLTVWDDDGVSNSTSKTVTIDNKRPIAEFTYTPETPKAGDVVRFTDESSDPDGKIVEWHWDFGDGTTSSEQNPVHIYTEPGVYTVRLKVYDDSGASRTHTKIVAVGPYEIPPDIVYHFPWWLIIIIGAASRLKSTVPITRPISQLVTPKSFYAVRKSNQFHYIFTGAYSVPESLGGW
jgi:PKD repeat protein